MPGVMWGTMQVPSLTIDGFRQRLERNIGDPDMHSFVAELDGRVVGNAGLHVGTGKRRHTGDLGISVRDEYVGQGIGRALMMALLDLADNYLNLKRMELDVITDNEGAIHLYESLGFVREGIRRCALFRGGVFVDTLLMGRVRDG